MFPSTPVTKDGAISYGNAVDVGAIDVDGAEEDV